MISMVNLRHLIVKQVYSLHKFKLMRQRVEGKLLC